MLPFATRKTASSAASSAALLSIHLAAGLAAVAAALIFRNAGWSFPNCSVFALTGHTCISCGATRAVFALLRLQPLRSFLFNPIPVLTTLFMSLTVVFEIYCSVAKKRHRFRYGWVVVLVIFFVAFAYNLLRIVGLAPIPNSL